MKQTRPEDLSVDQLVQQFVALGLAQFEAELNSDIPQYNRLFRQMMSVEHELKRRPGDQRRALLRLYDHPNVQVRLAAVKSTLAVAPDAARRKLQEIADSREFPQAGDAGMSLDNLDRGIFKPT
jgi:uncharacterized protein DUF2019